MTTIDVKIDTDIVETETTKLVTLLNVLLIQRNITNITGTIKTHSVNLWFVGKIFTYSLKGKWDEETQTMPCKVFRDNTILIGEFNYHPLDNMGGLDDKAFINSFNSIFKS